MTLHGNAFLGTGWSFPPAFSRVTLGVELAEGTVDIQQSLDVLFSTSIGERIMLPSYGTGLPRRVFENMTTTMQTEIAGDVRQAVLRWEPRVIVDDVTVQADPSIGGLVLICVEYTIELTNSRGNYVYPFYLQEASLAPPA